VQKFVGGDIPNAKKAYKPEELLSRHGFQNIEVESFYIDAYENPEDLLLYVQSTSVWNLVPTQKQQSALAALRNHFEGLAQDGKVKKSYEVRTVVATKF
jgi:hypothetical protein